jgi:hypothetical protein
LNIRGFGKVFAAESMAPQARRLQACGLGPPQTAAGNFSPTSTPPRSGAAGEAIGAADSKKMTCI